MVTGIIPGFPKPTDVRQVNPASLCQQPHHRPPSVQGVRDLVIQVTGLVVAAKLAQRCLVQVKHNLAQRVGWGITGGKALPINLAQRADQRGAVLVADFAILVALAIVETCLAHAALPCAYRRNNPPAGLKWQSCTATGRSSRLLLPVSGMNKCTFWELVRQVKL